MLALALFSTGACSSKEGANAGAAASAQALTPVPAPAGLLAELCVPQPAATWTKLRSGVGGPAVFLPQGFGAVVTTLAGLPITMAAEIDENVPVVGAVLRQGKAPAQVTLAVHVKAGDRFIDQLTRGESARLDATVDNASRVTLLTDKINPESARVALGVLGNYLLIAQKPADLTALGPYVVRTLPTRPAPKEEIVLELPEAALAGPALDYARELRGRSSESATAALVPIGGMLDTLIGLLGDAQAARVAFNLDASVIHGRATITPKPGGGAGSKLVADLSVGDTKPLLDLPEGTSVGILWRESAAARGESAPKQADALAKLLGKDVTQEDRDAVLAALRGEAEARGDWQAIGVAFNGTGPTALVRAPVSDADKMKKALKQLVDLSALPSFKKALSSLSLKLSVEKAVVENLAGDVTRVRLARVDDKDDKKGAVAEKGNAKGKDDKGKDAKGKDDKAIAPPPGVPNAIDLLYLVNGDGLFASAGFDPKDSLRSLARGPSPQSLGSNASVASALAGIGDASFVLVADLLRISAMTTGAAAPGAPTPIVIAAGRTAAPAELWGRVDAPFAVLQQLATEYMRRSAAPPAPPPAAQPAPVQ
ncbi:Hypothetical protein A7982_11090 [Minicystis rosea]|nr:Hypothetical protein A7982_11090 [Minicystis rosea]